MPVLETLGFAVGVAALVSTALDLFDVVIKAKKLTVDFSSLNSLLNTTKWRFYAFSLAYGLMAGPDGRPPVFDSRLQAPPIASIVEDNVRSVLALLQEAQEIVKNYENASDIQYQAQIAAQSPSGFRNTLVASFRRQKERKFGLNASKWSVYHCERFDTIVHRVGDLVDGMYGITESLDLLERQRQALQEVVSISIDAESVRIIRDSFDGRDDTVSTISEMRLVEIASTVEQGSSHATFASAMSRHCQIPEGDEHGASGTSTLLEASPVLSSQSERIMAEALAKNRAKSDTTNFVSTRDALYGQAIQCYKDEHTATGLATIKGPVTCLSSELNFSKRMLKELEHMCKGNDPGITITPINGKLDHLLGGVEGPPGTPYESGIFWMRLDMPENYPVGPPKVTFLTRVYHPNIDAQGKLCLSILEYGIGWSPILTCRTILSSITSLLAESGLEDPLVVEIAQTYVNDRKTYDANAAEYTRRFAHQPPPILQE